MDSVSNELKQTPPAVDKAKAIIKDGEKLINTRQKHTKIADISEFGWAIYEKRLFRTSGNAGKSKSRRTPLKTQGKRLGLYRRLAPY